MRVSISALTVAGLVLAAAPAAADCPAATGDPLFYPNVSRRCVEEPPALPQLRIGIEAGFGIHGQAVPVDHHADTVALPVEIAIVDALRVGLRLRYLAGDDAGEDGDGDRIDDVETGNPKMMVLTGGPRLVLHTEPARREAWRFEASGGYAFGFDGAESGPVIAFAVGRQAGSLFPTADYDEDARYGFGWNFGLTLHYEQGLGPASDYRAVMLTGDFAVEPGVPLPDGPRPRRTRPDVEYTLTGDVHLGGSFREEIGFGAGAALTVGLPLGTVVEPRVRGEVTGFAGIEADGLTSYAVFGGLKLSRWWIAWLELLGGYEHTVGTASQAVGSGPALEVTVGAQFANAFGCGLGFQFGQRTRIGVGEDNGGVAFLISTGLTYDNLVRAAECRL